MSHKVVKEERKVTTTTEGRGEPQENGNGDKVTIISTTTNGHQNEDIVDSDDPEVKLQLEKQKRNIGQGGQRLQGDL